MPTIEYDQVLATLKEEIAKYYDGDLRDGMAIDDLNLVGDDLTAVALALEKQLRFRLDRNLYPQITTIADWAGLVHAKINDR